MDTRQNRFFDPVCPALPVLHADDQQICAELADSLASHGVGTADFDSTIIASMLIGSQHLRRLALKYHADINDILAGQGSDVMARAEQDFRGEMDKA